MGLFDIESSRWSGLDTDGNGKLDSRDSGFVDDNNDGADDRTVFSGNLKVGGGGAVDILFVLMLLLLAMASTGKSFLRREVVPKLIGKVILPGENLKRSLL